MSNEKSQDSSDDYEAWNEVSSHQQTTIVPYVKDTAEVPANSFGI
jgi:hypothetical protein